MSNYQFEHVDVPAGSYVGWGPNPGQVVTGKVLSFDAAGGTDFNGGACPQVSMELLEPAVSINKQGDQTQFPAGDLVVISGGQANLKRALNAANLSTGDVVKITYSSTTRPATGPGKLFDVAVARGAAAGQTNRANPPAQPVQQFTQPAPFNPQPAQQFTQAAPAQAQRPF